MLAVVIHTMIYKIMKYSPDKLNIKSFEYLGKKYINHQHQALEDLNSSYESMVHNSFWLCVISIVRAAFLTQ